MFKSILNLIFLSAVLFRQRSLWRSLERPLERRLCRSQDIFFSRRRLLATWNENLHDSVATPRKHPWLHRLRLHLCQLLHSAVARHSLLRKWFVVRLLEPCKRGTDDAPGLQDIVLVTQRHRTFAHGNIWNSGFFRLFKQKMFFGGF